MRGRKREKCIVVLMLCLSILTGCVGSGEKKAGEQENKVKIGFSFDSFLIERWHREQDAFVARANQLGAEVDVQNANGEVAKQIEQIEYFIKNKVDVIVIVAIDGETLIPVLKKAQEADIKIVAYDRLIRNANVDLYISFDNAEIGRLLTESIIEKEGNNGKVLAIFGAETDPNVEIITAEFKRLMENQKINVVKEVYAKNWRPEEAFNAVSNWIKQDEDIDGIFCGNDDLAGEAIRALAEKRLAGKVCVVGQDADLSACQRIVEGTQEMTVYKDVIQLAKLGAEYAVELATNKETINHKKSEGNKADSKVDNKADNKEHKEEDNDNDAGHEEQVNPETLEGLETINDGVYQVPCYLLKPVKVTKENMNEVIIESGFHQKEDVYLNLIEEE